MPHRTSIESDGKTVYIHSGTSSGGRTATALACITWLAALGLFGLVLLELTRERGGLLLAFLLLRFAAYPVLRRLSQSLLTEEIQLDTRRLVTRRTYGFIRGRQHTTTYRDGELSTGAEPTNRKATALQVSWYTERPAAKTPKLIYRHFFPMSSADYEMAKAYVQELYDLDASDQFELLFSAN